MPPTAPIQQKDCPSCAAANPADAQFCVGCGSALGPAPSPAATGRTSGWDWERLRPELARGLQRFWPALLLIAFTALFDYRLKGQLWFTLLAGGGASLALLLLGRFTRFVEPLTGLIPRRFVGPVLTAVPVAFLYLARWKGTQSDGSALLTAAIIVGFSFLIAAYRQQLNERLSPFYEQRDRLLPRPLRLLLVFVVPILLTFILVHRDLGDIGALFGGTTSSPRPPTGGNTGFLIILTTALSAAAAFLLLNEPAAARTAGRTQDGARE